MNRAEGFKKSSRCIIHLDIRQLSPFGQLAWIQLVVLAAQSARQKTFIRIHRSALAESVRVVAADSRFHHIFSTLKMDEGDPPEPNAARPFVFLTGSAVLSPKLIARFPYIYLEPSTMPSLLESRIYWDWIARPNIATELDSIVGAMGDKEARRQYEDFLRQLQSSDTMVSLLTSVFKGDDHLEGFLSNVSELELYDRCEHFLIRPGSPGGEHPRLLAHVRRWPAAVYINMVEDPGLYEVWNLGTRLATGRYLSNANLDDRRAPQHLSALVRELENKPDIAAASTALRITQTPNLKWEESDSCQVWSGDLGSLRDLDGLTCSVDRLIKKTRAGLSSRNFLNCMPVWRRQLHALNGWFNEKVYGPSADWEFWLRAGLKGMKYRLLARPLGLFLKDTVSYWHRANPRETCDRRILSQYGYLYSGEQPPENTISWPFSLDLATLTELAAHRSWLEAIGWCLVCTQRLRLSPLPEANRKTVSNAGKDSPTEKDGSLDSADTGRLFLEKYGGYYFGIHSLPDRKIQTNLGGILNFIVDSLLKPDRPFSRLNALVLKGALIDGYVCSGDRRWLVTAALLHHQMGDETGERSLLQAIRQENPAGFLKDLHDIYGPAIPLPD